jgi:hypothetical protein
VFSSSFSIEVKTWNVLPQLGWEKPQNNGPFSLWFDYHLPTGPARDPDQYCILPRLLRSDGLPLSCAGRAACLACLNQQQTRPSHSMISHLQMISIAGCRGGPATRVGPACGGGGWHHRQTWSESGLVLFSPLTLGVPTAQRIWSARFGAWLRVVSCQGQMPSMLRTGVNGERASRSERTRGLACCRGCGVIRPASVSALSRAGSICRQHGKAAPASRLAWTTASAAWDIYMHSEQRSSVDHHTGVDDGWTSFEAVEWRTTRTTGWTPTAACGIVRPSIRIHLAQSVRAKHAVDGCCGPREQQSFGRVWCDSGQDAALLQRKREVSAGDGIPMQ